MIMHAREMKRWGSEMRWDVRKFVSVRFGDEKKERERE